LDQQKSLPKIIRGPLILLAAELLIKEVEAREFLKETRHLPTFNFDVLNYHQQFYVRQNWSEGSVGT